MERRILLVLTDLEIGGTPTVVREVAVRLNRPGVRVQVACLGRWGPVAGELREAGIAVTALGAVGAWDVRVIGRLVKLIRGERIDTVLSFLMHANAAAAVAGRFCGGTRFFQSIQTTQAWPRWHWWVQRMVQHWAEKVVVPSESAARCAREWADVPAEKVVVIANGIDPDAFGGEGRERVKGRPAAIGFIGRLDRVKRIGDLLEAVAILDGKVHLHIFGEGSERERIEARIGQLEIRSMVTMHGRVSRPQGALEQVELLVLPSEAEGFGLVLIEAMAAGVAVVATDAPGIRDVVRHERTGLLVPVGAPGAIAEAVRRVLEDECLRTTLIQSGRAEARERFSWGQIVRQYEGLLGNDEIRNPKLESMTNVGGE